MKEYIEFLKDKMAISHQTGFEVNPDELTPSLYPHVKDTVRWAISGGCRAIFSSFGMQKTVTQLEILRVILNRTGGKGLIVCPKRVVVEFLTQAEQHLGMKVTYVRTMQEVKQCPTNIMVTNYERVRDGEDGVRIEPSYFTVTSLDEASVLRGFGTKTYQEFLPLFAEVPYRFVATATPSPNRYKELIHYAGYLGGHGHRTGPDPVFPAGFHQGQQPDPLSPQGKGILVMGKYMGVVPHQTVRPRLSRYRI